MVFTPFRLRELELKNRWIMLAMHTGFATGNALTERDYAFYEERAKGGAAAVTVLLAVNEAGALKGMYDAETVEKESLRTLAERVHAHDCRLIVQLFHCGRNESAKNHGEKPLLAPSAVASPIFRAEPQEMTAEELAKNKGGVCQCGGIVQGNRRGYRRGERIGRVSAFGIFLSVDKSENGCIWLSDRKRHDLSIGGSGGSACGSRGFPNTGKGFCGADGRGRL